MRRVPEPTGSVVLAGGRRLAYDDVGDPAGAPIVYLHGCPDCRLCRHPDDGLAGEAGVRLVAIDRPGYGRSDPDVAGTELSLADDVVALADSLGLGRFAVLGFSSGGPAALAIAAKHPHRVTAAGVAAGQLVTQVEAAPDAFARMAAPLTAPLDPPWDLAVEAVVEGKNAAYLADLAAVDGLREQLALNLIAAVEHGLAGVEGDLRSMVSPWPFDPASIRVPVRLWYGTADHRVSPEDGRALGDQIPGARLEVVDGASHLLPFVHWKRLLTELAIYT